MWTVVAALLLHAIALAAFADDGNEPDRTLTQLHHTAWGARDGAPPDIWALAQAADGYLWLGAGTGLYRFDGIRFERLQIAGEQLLSNNITALTALPSGELWIGYYFGGITLLKNGRFTHYTPREGAPTGTVFRFAVDHRGALWAATSGGLARFANDRWRIVGDDWNFSGPRADWVHVDRDGTVWVATRETLMFLRAGAAAFEATGEHVGLAVLAEAPDGRLWISDEIRGTRPLADLEQGAAAAPRLAAPLLRSVQSKRLLFDRAGNLWGTDALRGGLYRIHEPQRVPVARSLAPEHVAEGFKKEHGLTSDIAVPLLEDDQGNIWVGTNLGLNRFRRSDFVVERRIDATSPFGYLLAPAPDGAMYIVNSDSLLKVGASSFEVIAAPLPQIVSAHTTREGKLWLGSADGLRRLEGRRLIHTPLPDPLQRRGVQAITTDRDGDLWISIQGAGLHRFQAGAWRPVSNDRLPSSAPTAAFTDSHGRLWFGYPEGVIALLDRTHVQVFTGLGVGPVMSISEGRRHIWAGGDLGLARFDGSTMRTLLAGRVPALSGISGVLEANGSLWLNGLLGIVRAEVDAIERALNGPDHVLEHDLFDARDGLPGVAQQASPVPTLAADADGRLWFATNQGIVWMNPARAPQNTRAPPVVIRSISAGGRTHPPRQDINFPKRTADVRIEYTALDLSMPERIRFSYKLDGVDDDWRDAGGRREVVFTNLGPGSYRFQLRAANGGGPWSEQPAKLDFGIDAAIVQTRSFAALCVAAMLLMAWLAHRLHIRQVAARLRGRLEERLIERERIARELHDTLLQGVQGLILRFQSVLRAIPPGERARAMMEETLDRADRVLIEGRDRVQDLRTSLQSTSDLPQALASIGEQWSQQHSARFRVTVAGVPRALHPIAREETCRIGAQALSNAFQHSHATQIEVEIAYEPKQLRLRFRDDGRGIERDILDAGGRHGHWGLAGMRERAQRLRAHLHISSRPGTGTEIELRVPASLAYVAPRRSGWRALVRLH